MDIFGKIIHGQKHPDSWFQVLPGFDSEYAKVYRGLGGVAPQSHRPWRMIRARGQVSQTRRVGFYFFGGLSPDPRVWGF